MDEREKGMLEEFVKGGMGPWLTTTAYFRFTHQFLRMHIKDEEQYQKLRKEARQPFLCGIAGLTDDIAEMKNVQAHIGLSVTAADFQEAVVRRASSIFDDAFPEDYNDWRNQ